MKKTLCALLLMLPIAGLGAPKKVTVLTDPADQWPAATQNLMEKAAAIVFERINEHDIAQCAYRNAFRENVDKVRRQWGSEITVLNKNPEVTLKVLKKKLDRSILGLAQLNKAKVDPTYFRIHQLEIILNETNLNDFVAKYPAADGDQDLSIWVNTIAHELAHNFGLPARHERRLGQGLPWLFSDGTRILCHE